MTAPPSPTSPSACSTACSGSRRTSPPTGRSCCCIDDLHWCDPASLRFVAYLERRLEGLQVCVAAAARTSERPSDSRLLAEIADDPAAVSVHPHELSEAAVAELVRGRLGADAEQPFCAACHRRPVAIRCSCGELLKTLQAEDVRPDRAHADAIRDVGPRAVSRTVLLRLARLPPDAVPVARAVAVLGDGAGLPAVATVAETRRAARREATRAPWPARRSCARSRRSASCTRWSATPSITTSPGGARAAARARGESTRRISAPRPSWWQRSCSPSPSRAAPVGRGDCCGRGSGGTAPRCDRERGAVPATGARGAAAAERARAAAAGARVGGGLRDPAGRRRAHQPGARSARRPRRSRAHAAAMLGRMLLFTGLGAGGGDGRAGRARSTSRRARGHAPGARGARALHRRVRRAGAGRRAGAARARARRRAPEGGGRQHAQRRRRLGLGAAGRHRAAVLRARARLARRRLADRPGRGVHGPRRRPGARRRRTRRVPRGLRVGAERGPSDGFADRRSRS